MLKYVGCWVVGGLAVAACGHTREGGQPDAAATDAADGQHDASWSASPCPGASDVANVAVVPQQHVNFPQLVRAGARTGMVWTGATAKNFEVQFAWLDDQMQIVGTPTVISPDDGAQSLFGVAAWSGSELGFAYDDSRTGVYERPRAYFVRADATGKLIPGSELELGTGDGFTTPVVAWDPVDAQWAVAAHSYATGSNQIWFERLDAHGAPIADSTVILDNAIDGTISAFGGGPLLWTGDHWALAYLSSATGQIVISEIRLDGTPVHDITIPNVLPRGSQQGAIATDGTHYLVGWIEWQDSDDRLNVALADGQGLVANTQTTLGVTVDAEPSIAWTGSQFAVAFRGWSHDQTEIWAARVDAAGALVPGSLRALTCDAQLNGYPGVSPGPSGELDISYAAQDPSGNLTINGPEVNDLRVLRILMATQQ